MPEAEAPQPVTDAILTRLADSIGYVTMQHQDGFDYYGTGLMIGTFERFVESHSFDYVQVTMALVPEIRQHIAQQSKYLEAGHDDTHYSQAGNLLRVMSYLIAQYYYSKNPEQTDPLIDLARQEHPDFFRFTDGINTLLTTATKQRVQSVIPMIDDTVQVSVAAGFAEDPQHLRAMTRSLLPSAGYYDDIFVAREVIALVSGKLKRDFVAANPEVPFESVIERFRPYLTAMQALNNS